MLQFTYFFYVVVNKIIVVMVIFSMFNFFLICKYVIHDHYHNTESNYDYIFANTSEFYNAFLCFYDTSIVPFIHT